MQGGRRKRSDAHSNRIQEKYTAKWGVQIAGMIFQTRSRQQPLYPVHKKCMILVCLIYNLFKI